MQQRIAKQKLVERLDRELYAESQGDACQRGYRAGWNDRARSLKRDAEHTLDLDLDGIDLGGES